MESLGIIGLHLVALFGFFLAGCACCGSCSACSGTTFTTATVVLSGVTNGTCLACAAYNATYVLDVDASNSCISEIENIAGVCVFTGPLNRIRMLYEFQPPPTSQYNTYFQIGTMATGSFVAGMQWRDNNGSTKPACLGTNVDLPQFSAAACTITGSTCTLTTA